ncbi:MAG: LytTR family DNA-binding domain-containing protein [Terriglobales bacterium]
MVIVNNHYGSYCRTNDFFVLAGARPQLGAPRIGVMTMKALSSKSSESYGVRLLSAEQGSLLLETMSAPQAPARSRGPRVAIKAKGKILLISPFDVIAVQSQGNYVLLQQDMNSYLLRDSISVVARKLEPFGFIRIHRSVLVNASFVEVIMPYSTGEYGLQVRGGREYTVTRTYKNNLRFLAKFWIGTGAFPD